MGGLVDANNAVARLIQERRWNDAERELEQVEALLRTWPKVDVEAPARELDLAAALDEFHCTSNRVLIGWHRARYEETLPYARRAWMLEKAIVSHVAGRRGMEQFMTSIGAWGVISFLSRCGRYEAAARIFSEVLGHDEWFIACRARADGSLDELLLAGVSVFLDSRDRQLLERGRIAVSLAQDRTKSHNTALLHAFADYWSLLDEPDRAFDAIQRAIEVCDYEPARLRDDPMLVPLHPDERWPYWVLGDRFRWIISTTPPGAVVFLNGVSLGFTPLEIEPPKPGRYRLRVELEGYQAQEELIVAVNEDGRRIHRPLTVAAVKTPLRPQELAYGTWTPDPAARDRTRTFLGDFRHARAYFDRESAPERGGLSIGIDGDGVAMLRKEASRNEPKRTARVQLQDEDIERFFNAFVKDAFLDMGFPEVLAPPGTVGVVIELINGTSTKHRVSRYGHPGHDGFDRLIATFKEVTWKYLDDDQKRELL